ncbi:MAG: hypothetical protein K0S74_1124 [Chlamydiales bacterium]|jgi:hypothetical protein|nr:hypothetical protein [Chlamydiales bacterium]
MNSAPLNIPLNTTSHISEYPQEKSWIRHEEVAEKFFPFLPLDTLSSLSMTCKRMKRFASTELKQRGNFFKTFQERVATNSCKQIKESQSGNATPLYHSDEAFFLQMEAEMNSRLSKEGSHFPSSRKNTGYTQLSVDEYDTSLLHRLHIETERLIMEKGNSLNKQQLVISSLENLLKASIKEGCISDVIRMIELSYQEKFLTKKALEQNTIVKFLIEAEYVSEAIQISIISIPFDHYILNDSFIGIIKKFVLHVQKSKKWEDLLSVSIFPTVTKYDVQAEVLAIFKVNPELYFKLLITWLARLPFENKQKLQFAKKLAGYLQEQFSDYAQQLCLEYQNVNVGPSTSKKDSPSLASLPSSNDQKLQEIQNKVELIEQSIERQEWAIAQEFINDGTLPYKERTNLLEKLDIAQALIASIESLDIDEEMRISQDYENSSKFKEDENFASSSRLDVDEFIKLPT